MTKLSELIHHEFRDYEIIRSVPHSEVTHFTSSHKYVIAHHAGGEVLIADTLKRLLIEDTNFVRIHRSTIVRRALLKSFIRYPHEDDRDVMLTCGKVLKISRRYNKSTLQYCKENEATNANQDNSRSDCLAKDS